MTETGGKVAHLIEQLAFEIGEGTVDLRWSRGVWYVLVPHGGMMTVVPGSGADDPMLALLAALDRWRRRSDERPFIP